MACWHFIDCYALQHCSPSTTFQHGGGGSTGCHSYHSCIPLQQHPSFTGSYGYLGANMDVMEFLVRPTIMACNSLLRHNDMPPGTPQLLGNGLNFCVKQESTNDMIHHTFNCLEKYIRRFWALRGSGDDGDFNPSIYLKSDYVFKLAPIHIEQALKPSR